MKSPSALGNSGTWRRALLLLDPSLGEAQCEFFIKGNGLSDKHISSSVMLSDLNFLPIPYGHLEIP